MKAGIYSETGILEAVLIHTPGPEVENMTPENAERALYSDILNLHTARHEFNQFSEVIRRQTKVFELKDLLDEVMKNTEARRYLINKVVGKNDALSGYFDSQSSLEVSRQLIEGVKMNKNTLTQYLSKDRFSLQPLHNLFFTRDASSCIYDHIIINKMASQVRVRESQIMETVFRYHPGIEATIINPSGNNNYNSGVTIEGGDIIVASEEIMLIGIGARTNSLGVDYIIDYIKKRKVNRHIIVQELPLKPESFIHLDMVFTLLSREECMVYDPVILKSNRYLTIHIHIENGEVIKIEEVQNIPVILNKLGMELKPLLCGGSKDPYIKDREQWHSGANFFAIAPGRVVGYGRNYNTIEELNNNGYEVITANDVINGVVNPADHSKYVITIEGDELARGGGGCRCMTMPLSRRRL